MSRYNRADMEIKRFTTRLNYRIEPNPNGGFIARSDDLAVPALEAATREELLQQINAKVAGSLATTFPNLEQLLQGRPSPVGSSLGGAQTSNLVVRTKNGTTQINQQATREEIEQFAQEFAHALGENFPEVSEALKTYGGDAKTLAAPDGGTKASWDADMKTLNVTSQNTFSSSSSATGSSPAVVENTPITPETSRSWMIFGFLAALATVVAAIYLLLQRG